ncbi:MAG TPA: M15 family metallopeptidase [Candidatus Saccharimonadales bacterium]|nr:M15 family metallopeptidase [Candidatus Saccharimonadales bacterium]
MDTDTRPEDETTDSGGKRLPTGAERSATHRAELAELDQNYRRELDNEKVSFLARHKRKLGFGGLAAALTAALIFGFFALIPLKLLHIKEILFKHNFGSQEQSEKVRGSYLTRRFLLHNINRNGSRKIITAKGFVADRITNFKLDRFEVKLNDLGYELKYQNGQLIDILKDGRPVDLGEGTRADRRAGIYQAVDEAIPHWRVGKRLKYRRLMSARASVRWRFFEGTREKAKDSMTQRMNDYIAGRESKAELRRRAEEPINENDSEAEKQRKRAANEALHNGGSDELIDTVDSGSTDASVEKLKGKLVKGAGIAGLVLLACGVRDVANSIDEGIVDQRSDALIRTGNLLLVTSSQLKDGRVEALDGPELNDFMQKFESTATNAEGKKVNAGFTQAAAWRRATGQPVKASNPDLSEAAHPDKSRIAAVAGAVEGALGAIPGLGITCKVGSTFVGQALAWVVDLGGAAVTGGTSAVAALIAQDRIISFALPKLISFITNQAISGAVNPVELLNNMDAGLNLSKNEYARNLGGRELSNSELAAVESDYAAKSNQEFGRQSLPQRLLAVDDSRSLASKLIAQTPATPQALVATIGRLPNIIAASFGQLFGGLSPAYAAELTGANPYGFPQYGFTAAEVDQYDPIDNEQWVNQNTSEEEQKEFDKCFDDDYQSMKDNTTCKRRDEKFNRYRMYRLDKHIVCNLETLSNNEEEDFECAGAIPDEAGEDPDGDSGMPGQDTSGTTCPAGTDAGVERTFQGNSVRLCRVRGITVNSSIAKQLDQMLAAAEGSGLRFGGSGFRSYQRQVELRRQNCPDPANSAASACRPPTAKPGRSMHEQGLAIDFTYNGSLIRSRSNPGFQWLNRNAGGYGFKNLESEPWHWSINGR